MNIDEMSEQFEKLAEMKAYSEAQTKTIIDLTKKLRSAEEQVKHLKMLVENTVPVTIDDGASDEEKISRQQLYYMKIKSEKEELTLEETKRVEIYTKILAQLKNNNKNNTETSKDFKTEDLLALVSNEANGESK